MDGSGGASRSADVRIVGSRIVEVGSALSRGDAQVVDGRGLVVSPGFIDLHAHSEGPLWRTPEHTPKVRQGVTFELLGQDGLGYAPFESAASSEILEERLTAWHGTSSRLPPLPRSLSDFADALQARGMAINAGFLVPHGTIRLSVMGDATDAASPSQLERMAQLVDSGIRDGGFGLSTGLVYPPARFAPTEELVSLCSAMDPEALFVPHLRDYGAAALSSYREAIEIAEAGGVNLHLTHAVLNGPSNIGAATGLLEMLRESAPETTLDIYPYDAGSTYLHVFLPDWIASQPKEQQRRLLGDPASRDPLSRHFRDLGLQWDQLYIAGVRHPALGRHVGASIAEIGQTVGTDPLAAYCDILLDDDFASICVNHNGHMENVDTLLLEWPRTAVASDSILVGQQPHPRAFGTFARFLERYVRSGEMSIEEGIRRITGLPARILRLANRGTVTAGSMADIVCFDPGAVRDNATFANPSEYPTGFVHVFVNGSPVILDGQTTNELPGRFVRSDLSTHSSRVAHR